ncbi:MAG: carboxypeptidase-like regulatory domain-containing protein, partial [Rhodospirillaceae bacterium]
SVPWGYSGARFPFAPARAGVGIYGSAAPWTAVTRGVAVIWLATSRDGKVCVVRASGFTPQVISTYPLEMRMQDYRGIAEAVADGYSDAGHSFYLLNFDREDVPTLAWDSETGIWSERGTWVPESNRWASWRPRFYANAFGEHRMLDTSNGNLYRMSSDLVRDVDSRLIRRLRRAPGLVDENKRAFYSSFELDLEPGLGEEHGHVSFQAIPVITTVSGEVTLDGDPVPDVEIIIEVDGEEVGTTTTDEDGEYEVEGVPDGEVTVHAVVEVDGEYYCAEDVGTATGTGVFTSPGTLVLNLTLSVCGLSASFTAISSGAFGDQVGVLTLTPTVTNGSGDYSYLWTAWTEHGGTEEAPDFTSTDEIGIWTPLYEIAFSGICNGEAKLIVTDNATGASVISGPDAWTWECI